MMTVCDQRQPRILRHCLPPIALGLLGAVVYGWVAWHAYSVMSFSDSLDYLSMAEFYSSKFRGTDPGEAALFYRATRFPPLFPLVLGVFGAGASNQHLASIIGSTLAVAAPIAVWWWTYRETGSSRAALLLGFALLLNPVYFLMNLTPVSEPLAILLYAAALAILAKGTRSARSWLVASLIVGIAVLARTAMLPMAIALLICAVHAGHRARNIGAYFAASFVPYGLWSLYRRNLGADDYTSRLDASAISSALGGWPDALWLQPIRLFQSATDIWGLPPSLAVKIVTFIIALLAAAGMLVRMRQFKIDAWFLAGYVAMILIWPFPVEITRFLVLVLPIILLAAWTGFDHLLRAMAGPRAATRLDSSLLIALLIVVASLPAGLQFVHRAMLPVQDELLDDKRELFFFTAPSDDIVRQSAEVFLRTRLLVQDIKQHVPRGECVYATMEHLVGFYGGVNALHYPPSLKSQSDAREQLRECRYFFVMAIDIVTENVPAMYPTPLLLDWTRPVLVSNLSESGGSGTAAALLEVAPDPNPPTPLVED